MSNHENLPPVSSPNIILTNPTDAESRRIWTATHSQWGNALTLQNYLDRETYLLGAPLSRNGGQTQWLLTDRSSPPGERPILASCETIKKPVLVAGKDGIVKEGIAHGIASVFTFAECRGKGYAGGLMTLLGEEWKAVQEKKNGDAVCSVLYSDIGKKFYHTLGWKPFESAHLVFPVASQESPNEESLKPITYDDLPALATRDEQLIRQKLSLPSASSSTRVALLPDLETLHWHLYREDFMCRHIFSRTPDTRGAVYTPKDTPNSRVWAIWSRGFYGGTISPEKNTLHFLRFVVEDESISDEELAKAIKAIVGLAQSEARAWLCHKVELWNPDERVRKLVVGSEELEAEYVVRESDSIASLQWFGDGSVEDVEWIANEKYGWC
ncbi:hypothetical protein G7046_g6558 [Stylonectria norvegica]|nr:hypothetical protein G7046_g6558 [Stylonectria norvegica]